MTSFEYHPLHPGEGIPTFISAGIIKYPAQLESFLGIDDPLAAPALTPGSFTWDEWAGNGEPNFVYDAETKMAGNAVGLQNPGREGIRNLAPLVSELTARGIKTIVSVTNLPAERATDVVPKLAYLVADEIKPTAIEVNLGCPNGKIPGTDKLHPPLAGNADASFELLAETRKVVGDDVTLIIKDSPHVTDLASPMSLDEITQLADAMQYLIDGVVGINTIGNQPFSAITVTNGRGGMSGPIVSQVAKRHLSAWKQTAPDMPYFSVGGVDSENAGQEIPERLKMGAILVGGAQEFYRASDAVRLAAQWAIASV